MQDLFNATAAINTPEGLMAYKAFAAALTTPILQAIERQSIMRQLFAVERLGPGAQASYPVAEDFEIPVWVLPGLGYVAQNFIEGIGEEVYVPTFTIDASGDWKLTYARDSRIDIAARAAEKAAKAMADKYGFSNPYEMSFYQAMDPYKFKSYFNHMTSSDPWSDVGYDAKKYFGLSWGAA